MYIFSRSTVAALGRELDAIPASIEIGALASKIMGREVSVFAARFGAPQGSIMWSMRVESLADLQENTEKLMADSGYAEKAESMNGLFMTPLDDRFGRFVTTPLEAATSKYYGITRAAMANGKFGDAIMLGIEAAEYIGKSLNCPSAFVKAAYGGFGDVTWITGFDTMAEVDAFDDWQMADDGYHEIVDRAGDLFVENTGHTSLIEKLN
jgi:hypothetical protein